MYYVLEAGGNEFYRSGSPARSSGDLEVAAHVEAAVAATEIIATADVAGRAGIVAVVLTIVGIVVLIGIGRALRRMGRAAEQSHRSCAAQRHAAGDPSRSAPRRPGSHRHRSRHRGDRLAIVLRAGHCCGPTGPAAPRGGGRRAAAARLGFELAGCAARPLPAPAAAPRRSGPDSTGAFGWRRMGSSISRSASAVAMGVLPLYIDPGRTGLRWHGGRRNSAWVLSDIARASDANDQDMGTVAGCNKGDDH